jgi:tetratricopeptide (TPR) repeat protein
MALAQKKLSHKDMKEDYLMEQYFKVIKFYEEKKKLVHGILLGLLAVTAIVVWALNTMNENNLKATSLLGNVLPYFERGQYEVAINGIPQENIRGLKEIVENYGSSKAGKMAAFFLANSYYALGKYEDALTYFKQTDLAEDDMQASAIAGIGSCYEALKNNAQAAENYEKAAYKASTKSYCAEYMHHAAINYATSGNREKASSLYKKIKKDYPQTSQARESERYIAQFGE